MIVSIAHLTYSYEDSAALALDDVSFTLSNGWTGVVGENGAGKSTLLKLICGLIYPTAGSIQPRSRCAYCAQSTDDPPTNLEDFSADYTARTCQLRTLLGIDNSWLWRYTTLSPGERKRIQIACALAKEPMVLALDEPTNHLDEATRKAVLTALATYSGVGLLVSHDREFLDNLVQQCLFLDSGSGILVPGTYTFAKREKELREKTAQGARKRARTELSRLQDEASCRKAAAAETASRRSGRRLSPHDSDGRAKIGLAIVSGQDGKRGLLSSQMTKKLERAQQTLSAAHVKKTYDKPLTLITQPTKRSMVAHIDQGTLHLGEDRLLHIPTLHVGPTDRIGLSGPNGSGKSTLLNALLKSVPLNEKVLYIPQEIDAAQGRRLLAAIKEYPTHQRGRILSIVARLNSSPHRILAGESLSPGELRKLILAEGLLHQPSLIVMDEPTNHLDLHSIEALQTVLAACECALILVSHDYQFINALTDICWDFLSRTPSAEEGCETANEDVAVFVR